MQSILVCTDLSRESVPASAFTARLAAGLGAALHVLDPVDAAGPWPDPDTIRRRARRADADLIVLVPPGDGDAGAGAWERARALAFDTATPVLLAAAPVPLAVLTALMPLEGEGATSGELGAACRLVDCLHAARPLAHARPSRRAEIHLLHGTRDMSRWFDWTLHVERLAHAVESRSPFPPRTRIRKRLVWGTCVEDEIVRRMGERSAQLLMIGAGWRSGVPASGGGAGLSFLRRVAGPVMFLPWHAGRSASRAGAGGHLALRAN